MLFLFLASVICSQQQEAEKLMERMNDMEKKLTELKKELASREREMQELRHQLEILTKQTTDSKQKSALVDSLTKKLDDRSEKLTETVAKAIPVIDDQPIPLNIIAADAPGIHWDPTSNKNSDKFESSTDGWKLDGANTCVFTFSALRPSRAVRIVFPLFGYKTCNANQYKFQFFLNGEMSHETDMKLLPKRGQNLTVALESSVWFNEVRVVCNGRTNAVCLPKFELHDVLHIKSEL